MSQQHFYEVSATWNEGRKGELSSPALTKASNVPHLPNFQTECRESGRRSILTQQQSAVAIFLLFWPLLKILNLNF